MSDGPARALAPRAGGSAQTGVREPRGGGLSRVRPAPASRLRRLDVSAADEPSPVVRPARWPILLAALPLVLAGLYLGLVAADRYGSQASFVIREGGQVGGGISAGGLARNDDSAHAVVAYMRSRAAAEDLERDLDLRAILSRPEGDVLTRFPRPFADATQESLHHHLQDVVSVALDTRSGIVTLRVLAYRPEDARAVNEALLSRAERLVNAMNERVADDRVAFARQLVAEGEARMHEVQRRLSDFRTRQSMLDPGAQSAARLALATELTRSMAALDTEIAGLQSSAALSPRLPSLNERRRALAAQIAAIRDELAGSSGSLAPRLSDYERLDLDRELALRSLTAGYKALEQARQDAASSRLYLQRISAPSAPDRPSHPRSILILTVVAAASFALYTVARLLVRATMEHRS